MKKIIFSSIIIAIIGTLGIIFGTMVYVRGLVVHPDAVATVFNPTTNRRTQSYLIGDLQVYIEQTYRMKMSTFQTYVNATGLANYGDKFTMIPDGGDASLSLIKDDSNANANPFVVKLNIRNISEYSNIIRSRQFFIRHADDKLVAPNAAWQEKLAEAGIFSGVEKNDMNVLKPGEVKTLWLVYGTPTDANPFEQEYIRQLYGSSEDWLATKVEYPFNFVYGTPYGDYDEITNRGYTYGAYALLAFYALLGIIATRLCRASR